MTAIHHLIFQGINAILCGPFQKIEMLSSDGPALEEMACLKNLPCGTLDTKEQFVSFQVPPEAVQNRKADRQRCISCQDSSSSEHQIELETICLPSKTKLHKCLKSEKIIAESMHASLKSKSERLAMELPAEHLHNISTQKKGKAYRKLIETGCQLKRSREDSDQNLLSFSWWQAIALKITQRSMSQHSKSLTTGGTA